MGLFSVFFGIKLLFFLTLYLLMDLPIHIDILSMGQPIVYVKGSQVGFSKLGLISVPEGCFNLSKLCRP